ncbi:hypothetical protein NUSPORA_01969 [Nucleospora cyclopteri]
MSTKKTQMSPGTLVWAKFDDFCFWPGRIATEDISIALRTHKNRKNDCCVLFFGEELTYGLVPLEKVMEFKTHYSKYSSGDGSVDFQAALRMANSKEKFIDPPLELQSTIIPKKKVAYVEEPRTVSIKEASERKDNTSEEENSSEEDKKSERENSSDGENSNEGENSSEEDKKSEEGNNSSEEDKKSKGENSTESSKYNSP